MRSKPIRGVDVEYLIVGAGLTGGVIARMLADAGRSVLIAERRSHPGGNVHDHVHASGITIHTYGPHSFRTNSEKLWRFVNRFAAFRIFEPIVKSYVDGRYENWPVRASDIRRAAGDRWRPAFAGSPSNFEEASLAMMPLPIYRSLVKGYTEKQWGVPARELSASLARRLEVRADEDPRLMQHKFQGLPQNGYAQFIQVLLAGIPVLLNCDYHAHRSELTPKQMTIYTGPIDEYFGFDLGYLRYRAQSRRHRYFSAKDWAQPCFQVNNPDPANGAHFRSIEWKHMMPRDHARNIGGTVLTYETPYSPTNPDKFEYPFPDQANDRLFKRYAERALAIPRLLICGRLGEYRYYDMDQAIARAQVLGHRILNATGCGTQVEPLAG
jgi:UDP-galactopyranose mutase